MHIKTLSTLCLLIFLSINQAVALDCPYLNCKSIKISPAQNFYGKLDIEITVTPGYEAHEWILYTADAPTTPSQTDVHSLLTLEDGSKGKEVSELGFSGRTVLLAQSNNPAFAHGLKFKQEYWAKLNKRRLSKETGTKESPLSQLEREKYLSENKMYNFLEPAFSDWLARHHLVKTAAESDMSFAWRVYVFLCRNYSYEYISKQERDAAYICTQDKTDCGGSSFLFVSIMRRNGIPARAIIGRNAKSSTHWEQSNSNELGTFHVKSEFYIPSIGWIPVDVARAMGREDERLIECFGNDAGDFLVMHIDPAFKLQSIYFGDKDVDLLQKCRFWVKGKGTFGSESRAWWNVIKEKI